MSNRIKILPFLLLFFYSIAVSACDIELKVEGQKKENYNTGDEIVVKVTVTFKHRVCELGIENTKFDTEGLKIESATKWKEVTPNVWERKLKIIVTGNQTGKLILNATRSCDKEGGKGSITLNSYPQKD